MSEVRRSGLTGLRQTDMLILQQLRDDELDPVCEVNAYLKSICDDPIFWYNRINNKMLPGLEHAIKYRHLNINDYLSHNAINKIRQFLGFDSLKEMSRYIDQIPEKARFQIYVTEAQLEKDIQKGYTINKEELPPYVDYDKLIQYLRRELNRIKNQYTNQQRFSLPLLPADIPGVNQRLFHLRFTDESFERRKKQELNF